MTEEQEKVTVAVKQLDDASLEYSNIEVTSKSYSVIHLDQVR